MRRFFKIFSWQLLKVFLAVLGAVLGFIVSLYIYAIQPLVLPNAVWESAVLFVMVCGALAGIAAPFLFEYRGRLTTRSFLVEVFQMLIAFVFVAVGFVLGIAGGIDVGDRMITGDGTGLAVMFFLLLGAILGVIPAMIPGALVITFWKLRHRPSVA